ncbi:uncharacterized protein ACMZJ9_003467 [Mantella aurantiaca]
MEASQLLQFRITSCSCQDDQGTNSSFSDKISAEWDYTLRKISTESVRNLGLSTADEPCDVVYALPPDDRWSPDGVMMQYPMRQQPYPLHQSRMTRSQPKKKRNNGWKVQLFGLTKKVDTLEKRPLTEPKTLWLRPWSPWYRVVGVLRRR